MRALVTGARGFVGTHLVAHLLGARDEVVAVDRECDVTDRAALEAAVGDAAPDVVYHLAALTHVGDSWSDPDPVRRVNVLGTANVLSAVRRAAPGALTLVVSSADVYGVVAEADLPLVETHPATPVSPYAQSKLEAERVALDAARSFAQRVVVMRPFNHLGPGQAPSFVVPALVARLLAAAGAHQREIVVGDLSVRRDFSDVRDVVRAYRLAVQFGHLGEVYNVASGHDVALGDLAARLVDRLLPGARLVVDPSLVRPVEVPVLRGSAAKLHEHTGWEPIITLSETLDDVVASMTPGPA